jgi:hypothetical protein
VARSIADLATLRDVDISLYAGRYLRGRQDTARYASFDYCFNYFQSFYEDGRSAALAGSPHMQTSCLQLGFYLASWGMFRGKAVLLQHSAKALRPAVEVIAAAPRSIWTADVHDYRPAARAAITDTSAQLRRALPGGGSQTLVTKAMLGVFGCVPAFDRYFRAAFGATRLGPKSLAALETYYRENAEIIEANRVSTIDFASGADTGRLYTRAKVIDMVFFTKGLAGSPPPDPDGPPSVDRRSGKLH